MCEFDWQLFADLVTALATVVIGGLSIYIAVLAHKHTSKRDTAQQDRERVAVEAFAAALYVELVSKRQRVRGFLRSRLRADHPEGVSVRGFLLMAAMWPPVVFSEHAVTSPSIGLLPRELAMQFGRVVGLAADRAAIQALLAALTKSGGFFEESDEEIEAACGHQVRRFLEELPVLRDAITHCLVDLEQAFPFLRNQKVYAADIED